MSERDTLIAKLEEREIYLIEAKRLLAEREALLREWLTYTGLRSRAFDPDLDPGDSEYESGRDLIRRTDAALSEASEGDPQP